MKLGTLKEGGRDGTLVVVSRDLSRAVRASDIAPTLQRVMDDWAHTETLLRQLLAISPKDESAHYTLGGLLEQNDPTPPRLSEAEQQTREALRTIPDSPEFLRQLGEILLREGKAPEAVRALRDALSGYEYDSNSLRLLGRALAQNGGDKTRTAKELGIALKTLYNKLARYRQA